MAKSQLHPGGFIDVNENKIKDAPKDWMEKVIEWGKRKYLPVSD